MFEIKPTVCGSTFRIFITAPPQLATLQCGSSILKLVTKHWALAYAAVHKTAAVIRFSLDLEAEISLCDKVVQSNPLITV